MGRFKKRKNNNKSEKEPEKKVKGESLNYVETVYVKENAAFEAFYKVSKSENEYNSLSCN
jgi:hypothetical protein